MKVLVTGATGQLGAAVVRLGVPRGLRLRCLVRDRGRAAALAAAGVELVDGDVTEPASLARAVAGVEAVIHCAGLVSYRPQDRPALQAVNVEGTASLLRAARAAGVRRFVFSSSIAAIGRAPGAALGDEGCAWDWGGLGFAYFDTKHAAHAQVLAAEGVEAVALCPGVMLGGGDVHENGLRVVRRVLRGGAWFAPSGQITAANVDDVAEAHLAALTRGEPGRAYILGGFAGPWRALFARIAAVTGGGPPRVTAPQPAMWLIGAVMELLAARSGAEPAMSRAQSAVVSANRAYSSAAATAALGYAPQPIEQGVAQCLAWARQTGRL